MKQGKTVWNKGKKFSEESRYKMRLAKLGRHFPKLSLAKKGKYIGSKNHRWITDRSKIKKGERSLNDTLQKQWSMAIKNRDKWICRIADVNCDGKLEAHHILPWSKFPELRYQINNGITLCHAHHPRNRTDVAKLSPFFQKLVASND